MAPLFTNTPTHKALTEESYLFSIRAKSELTRKKGFLCVNKGIVKIKDGLSRFELVLFRFITIKEMFFVILIDKIIRFVTSILLIIFSGK